MTSQRTASARSSPPSSAASSSSGSSPARRQHQPVRLPAAARAVAAPIPLLAPVISSTGSLGRFSPSTSSGARSRSRPPPCDNPRPVDPQRKRKIRLVVALSVAVLLAVALVYTSFSASTEAKEPSQLIGAAPGRQLRHDRQGRQGLGPPRRRPSCASASPTAKAAARASRSPTAAPSPTPSAAAARSSSPARSSTASSSANATRWSPSARRSSRPRMTASLGSVALALAFLARDRGGVAALAGRDGDRALGRRLAPRRLRACGLLTLCVVLIEIAFASDDFSFNIVQQHSSIETPVLLQDGGDVVEPGRLAAALGLGALDRLLDRALRDPEQAARDGPLRDRGDGRRRALLHRADAVRRRRQPVRHARARRRPTGSASTRCCSTRA